jgi:hypothetical protein
MTGLLINLILINKIIYLYKFNPVAKPGDIEYKLLKMISDKTTALTTIDPRRLFFESLYAARFMKTDQFGDYDATIFSVVSTIFFFTGTFFRLAQKVMEWEEKHITKKSLQGYLFGRYNQLIYVYYTGKKIEIVDEEKVINYGIRTGNYWHVTVYYLYCGFNMTEWGDEQAAVHFLKRIKEVSDVFENNYTEVTWHRLNGYCNIKFRKLEELLKTSEESINLALKTNNSLTLLIVYCFRSMAFTFRNELPEAKASLAEAEKLIGDLKTPLVLIHYLSAKCYLEINGSASGKDKKTDKQNILKMTGKIVKIAQRVKANLTEAYRLRAVAYWILNKPAGAAKNFKRSIKAGTGYGGNLELSRSYFEVGKFLRDPKNKKERILGMNGTECLLKAKAMFEEMNLHWDLQQYEKYMGSGS